MSNPAETFAGYEIIAEIGETPMGTVFKARDPLMDRTVALIIISPELSADAEYVSRFHSETIAVARLSHPHIVQLHTSGESEGACFVVTELVDGETLLQGIQNSGTLPLTDAVAICVSTAYALEYAWKKTQLIHGDINPANIWLTNDGRAKLSGLGLPKSIGGVAAGSVALNPLNYVSPELAKGDAGVDFRTDIYSLGCTLFHMVAGRPPFEASDDATLLHKHINEPPALLKAVPNCPAPLNALINKMLAKLPGIRHGSYEELSADLVRVHTLLQQEIEKKSTGQMQVNAGQSAGPRIVPRVRTVSRPAVVATAPTEVEKESRAMYYIAGGLAALVLMAGAVFWWVSRPKPEPPVTREPAPPPAVAKAAPSDHPADPFVREVFMLPAGEQVRRVVGVLKQINPDFDGKETHKVENDTVTELGFSTVAVTDIAPLRALTALRKLQCSGEGGMGLLADLSPLHGLRLQELKCYSNAVSDITPLKGMPLTYLGLRDTKVSDLAALQGMPLTHLEIRNTPVSDLSPLKGMKIEALLMSSTAVADLAPLQDMPLRSLFLSGTKVQDLSPLKGMSLSILHCSKTTVNDLSVLKGMPLKEIACDFKPERDVAVLRSIKTLERINATPAVEFWIKVGAQLAATPATNAASATAAATPVDAAFITGVAALPAEEQVLRVVAKLKALNPQFKGQETHKVENGKVTELSLVTVAVTDISPLRALPALQSLRLNGTTARGVLADLSCLKPSNFPALKRLWCHFTEVRDLSPLAGLPLEELYCDRTKVASLAPLRAMPLKELRCNFQPERDKEVLWAIKSLQTINDQPVAEFWKSVGPPEDPFFKQAATLPVVQLLPAVMAKLKELNPAFDGKQTHKIESGAVTELAISTAGVTDITPLKALKQLRRLSLTPWTAAQRGSLADLSPLAGLPLNVLRCPNNPISDLSPLKGMPLTLLICSGTQVSDLSPLTDMKLTVLWCNHTAVNNLGPLEGMPLTMLRCNSTPVADFAPLQRLPLQELHYNPKPELNAIVLGIKTLTKINDLPAAMFKMRAEMGTKGGSTTAQRPPAAGRATTSPPAETVGLSPKEQIRRFVEKMKELNRNFDGQVEHQTDGSKIVELSFSTDGVTDITPIRALTALKKLVCHGPLDTSGRPTSPGVLADLSPLGGLRLTELDCRNNAISSLAPLQGMPLTRLRGGYNPIGDLSPLKGMPLTLLHCDSKQVSNLTPLKGMKLTELALGNTQVRDLSPLKDMPIRSLNIGGTAVTDLSPLSSMPLAILNVCNTDVSDLTPLKNLRLTELHIYRTDVSDLSPVKGMSLLKFSSFDSEVTDIQVLKGMPLKELRCHFVAERDAKILRPIKTLEKINDLPADEFWKRVDAGESPQVAGAAGKRQRVSATSTTTSATLQSVTTGVGPTAEQVRRFVEKMKQLNLGFDGQAQYATEKGKVVRLEFSTEDAADISPVRAFTELKVLRCSGAYRNSTIYRQLADLSPLAGLSLKELNCAHSLVSDFNPLKGQPLEVLNCGSTQVTDLSPLKGMPLKQLFIIYTQLSDISPVRGMPLERFACEGSKVSDLSPLKGAPLQTLSCHRGKVTDLSVLRGLPLRDLRCDFVPDRDSDILRSIKTLVRVNDLPTSEFWQLVKTGEAPQPK